MDLVSEELRDTIHKVAPYVEERFGLSLYQFMEQKVEVESLYNYKIADILNLDKKQVGLLVRDFGLKRINGFSNRFDHRYGTGAIDTFKSMIEDPENSLSDVGRHFGFSREYARQVYEKIYGFPYTRTFKRKTLEKKWRTKILKRKPKIEYLREVREKMFSLGISSHIVKKRNIYRIMLQGSEVDVRISTKPSISGARQYFRIAYPKGTTLNCDIFICLCQNREERFHYIIPREHMPKAGICLIPQAKPHKSKYTRFKEAWDILKTNR